MCPSCCQLCLPTSKPRAGRLQEQLSACSTSVPAGVSPGGLRGLQGSGGSMLGSIGRFLGIQRGRQGAVLPGEPWWLCSPWPAPALGLAPTALAGASLGTLCPLCSVWGLSLVSKSPGKVRPGAASMCEPISACAGALGVFVALLGPNQLYPAPSLSTGM